MKWRRGSSRRQHHFPTHLEMPDADILQTIGFSGTTHRNGPARAGPPIPGPLGLESASLKGKVALVTGAGMFRSHLISLRFNHSQTIM